MIKLPDAKETKFVYHGGNGAFECGYESGWNAAIAEVQRLNATAQPVIVPEWTNEQCLEFLSIAFRHANISGDIEMNDIRLGMRMVNAAVSEKK